MVLQNKLSALLMHMLTRLQRVTGLKEFLECEGDIQYQRKLNKH